MIPWILLPSSIICAVLVIARTAPQFGLAPYEYFHEFYDHYGQSIQNHIEDVKRVHEEHHETQHRVHEKFQENYYDMTEKIQEGDENFHESQEKSNENIRFSSGTRKSLIFKKVNPQIGEREAKSFFESFRETSHR